MCGTETCAGLEAGPKAPSLRSLMFYKVKVSFVSQENRGESRKGVGTGPESTLCWGNTFYVCLWVAWEDR